MALVCHVDLGRLHGGAVMVLTGNERLLFFLARWLA
jgi:hypothetical protein